MTWLCFPSLTFNSGPICLTTCRSCVVYIILFMITGFLWDFSLLLEFIFVCNEWVYFAREYIFHSTPVPLCLSILFTDFYTEHFCSFGAKYIIWKPVLVRVFLIVKQALEFNLFPIIITSVFSFHLLSLQYPLLFCIIHSLTNLFLRVLQWHSTISKNSV